MMSVLTGAVFSAPAFGQTVTVAPGQTLWQLAAQYQTTVQALAAANGIADPNQVLVGTVLTIPDGSGTAGQVAQAAIVSIVVQRGDTLTSIAARYGTTVAALVAANGIADRNHIVVGTQLEIPPSTLLTGATTASSVSSTAPGSPPFLPPQLLAHPDRIGLRNVFQQWAANQQVPAPLLEALCWWESGWQRTVVSKTGAIGIGQLEPETADFVRQYLLHNSSLDPTVASDNIEMTAAFLHYLIGLAGGHFDVALAAYYQGLSSVQSQGMLPSTKQYVTGILAYASQFSW
jgi:LysM repeat protein